MHRCAGSAQVRDGLLPTPRARVAVRNHGHRQRPRDRQVGIIIGHTDILARIVRTVYPIADIRSQGQRLEAVQKPRRDVKVSKIVVVEQECLLFAEGRRIPADVYEDVVHGAMRATDELRLATAQPAVHASHDTQRGPRLRVLDEGGGGARRADVTVEGLRVECSGEQPSIVTERLRYQNEDAGEARLLDAHEAMVP